jgi:tetratricopeptide (TPR) repeat protein
MNIFSTIFGLVTLLHIVCMNNCVAADLEFGPYEVGFESYKVYDDSRPYLLNEDTISRPLLIHFWYPSLEKAEGNALTFKDYIDLIALREDFGRSGSEIDQQSFYYVKGYSDFAKDHFGLDTSLSVQSLLESPVYAKTGINYQNTGTDFPLLIYAPSNSKASVQNHMLCEYLASHGFMVLSVASAGPNSIHREKLEQSTMAQVLDMEYILKFCEDSLQITYAGLGLFGFSSGGYAITIFQMRNQNVRAVLSLDGAQEYIAYLKLRDMPDFDLSKADVPYMALVNNYENFSIYPFYHSVISTEKYLYRLPYLDHNGFISHWTYFDSSTPVSMKSKAILSFEYLSRCAGDFFGKYLKSERAGFDCRCKGEGASPYVQAIPQDYSIINQVYHALLDHDLDAATTLLEQHQDLLSGRAEQVNLLARMLADTDEAVWLYQKCVVYQPESWEAHFNLGNCYQEKGETLLARKALLRAKELSPDNPRINDLLSELQKMEQ